jgi:hypothetical protein
MGKFILVTQVICEYLGTASASGNPVNIRKVPANDAGSISVG